MSGILKCFKMIKIRISLTTCQQNDTFSSFYNKSKKPTSVPCKSYENIYKFKWDLYFCFSIINFIN